MNDQINTEQIIFLETPLPCGIEKPDTATGLCGDWAYDAITRQVSLDAPNWPDQPTHLGRPGEWIFLPICPTCKGKKFPSLYQRPGAKQ